MEETTFGETVLEAVTMVVIALVAALMLMATANIHFAYPARPPKPAAVQTTHPPKDHPNEAGEGAHP